MNKKIEEMRLVGQLARQRAPFPVPVVSAGLVLWVVPFSGELAGSSRWAVRLWAVRALLSFARSRLLWWFWCSLCAGCLAALAVAGFPFPLLVVLCVVPSLLRSVLAWGRFFFAWRRFFWVP